MAHVSDLHIGREFAPKRFPPRNPFAQIHDINLAVGLTRTLDLIRMSVSGNADLRVVMSGDLTATGSVQDFATAQTFMRGRWFRDAGPPEAGLVLDPATLAMVEGNHDQWGGVMLGNLHGVMPRAYVSLANQFDRSPWRKVWRSRSGRVELELFGLDSNAGRRGRNPLARGGLADTDLDALERALKRRAPSTGAVRVKAIVVHHSPSHRGLSLTLERRSRERLVRLAGDHGVCAILCGHAHTALRATLRSTSGSQTYELRAPTTLQGPADKTIPGFLLHRITLDTIRQATWTTQLYTWGLNNLAFDDPSPTTPWFSCPVP